MRSQGIKVKLNQAEKQRKYLVKRNLVRKDLKIKKDNEFVYIPLEKIPQELNQYKVIGEFDKIKASPRSYKEITPILDKLKEKLPTSYDIIGDIILIKLQDELLEYKRVIGESLLKTNKNIKTIYLSSPVKGELRVRDLEIISGEKSTKTIHREFGLEFEVDIRKTYFSPRLANERKRVANLVKPDEIVVDMFTGVAPFSIMIAKYSQPKIVYAIDKNKDAVLYAQCNVKRNNLLHKIEVIHADAKEIFNLLDQKGVKANRIIMNLPFSSYLFFQNALEIIADSCIIHYYDILKDDRIEGRVEELKSIARENNVSLKKVDIRKIKTYAPREFYIGIDITATKHADVA